MGLVTGACLAQVGNDVLCVDIDPEKIQQLNEGKSPIYEPGLTEMIRSNQAAGRLKFTLEPAEGVEHGLFQFIAVGTPPDEDGSADLSHVNLDLELDLFRNNPRTLCRKLNPRGDETRVVTWQWPRDVRRVVMVPPGWFLLIESARPFRCTISHRENVMAGETGLLTSPARSGL